MRYRPLLSSLALAALLFSAVALPPTSIKAQGQPPPAQKAQPQEVPPGPYKPVAIKLPTGLNDPSFDTFRNQLAEVAKKKDRAALARMVASTFFWVPEDTDLADKTKPAIDNMAKALVLDGRDSFGWDSLLAYAEEKTAMAEPQR